ncbi:MAG: hypothetical protein ACI9MR_000733 [Myxococcota bacterium]|jgi:hypothetical protein
MEALENQYMALPKGERLAFHTGCRFLGMLTQVEAATLKQRFSNELAQGPDPGASVLTKVLWDFRARELALRYLRFSRELVQRRLGLRRELQPDERCVALAMTASGSVVTLDMPSPDGSRAYQYRSGLSVEQGRLREGRVTLAGPVSLGRRLDLGKYNASEVIALAAGAPHPVELTDTWNEALPLFLPTGLHWDAQNYQVEMERFAVLKDTLVVAPPEHPPDRTRLVDWLVALAIRLQRWRNGATGMPLKKVQRFRSASGTRYGVSKRWGKLDLTRSPVSAGATSKTWENVTIGDQEIVPGAPLVVFAETPRGRSIRACIEQVDAFV